MKKIECIIFDWAGTTVDYGCFAPVAAFVKAFNELNIDITIEEARGPMGMTKIDHIRELFKLESVTTQFSKLFNKQWNEDDVAAVYGNFEKHLFASLSEFTTPIPHTIDTVAKLREAGLKIGSTSGYTAKMMEVVAPGAKNNGYSPDCYVTSDGLPAGRPLPFMIYQNMINLAVASPKNIVKVGDTISDIKEGVNAGVWSVGVIMGSSELGLSQEDAATIDKTELDAMIEGVKNKFTAAGAHYNILTLEELPALIEEINNEMNK